MSLFIIINHIALNISFYIIFAFLKKKKEEFYVNNKNIKNVIQTFQF